LHEVVLHRPSRERYASQKPHGALVMAPHPRRGSGACAVAPLEIGVQAVSLSPYRTGLAGPHRTRLPMFPAFPTCSCPLRLSPLGESMTQESPFALLLTVSRIQHRVPRRTLSPHPARQFPVFPAPGSTPWHGRMFRIVSALRISRPFAPFPEGNLLSFADGLL
jgi:hypothetical protein